jgi:hypothetical protein
MAPLEDFAGTFSAQSPTLEAYHILQHGPSPTERQPSGSSAASSNQGAMKGKRADYSQANRPKAYSGSSRDTQSSSSIRAENRAAQREVRTLPRTLSQPLLNSH